MISLRARALSARRSMSELKESPLVLYVDDERPNRIVFEQSLKTEFRIKTVADAKSALELLATEEAQPDRAEAELLLELLREPGVQPFVLRRGLRGRRARCGCAWAKAMPPASARAMDRASVLAAAVVRIGGSPDEWCPEDRRDDDSSPCAHPHMRPGDGA